MQRTLVTCAVIFGAVIVLVVAVIVIGGAYLSRPLPPIVIPAPPPLPADNGFDDCVRAASLVKEDDRLDGLDAAKQPREAEALVKLNRPALDLVRKALPKDYMTPRVKTWDEKFPYLKGYRSIGRLFLMEGQLKASAGDLSGAIESFLDARRFGALIPNGGSVIHRLVGVAISEFGYAGLESVCPKLDASQCRYMLKELDKADGREPSLIATLDWEKIMVLYLLKDMQEGKLAGTGGKPAPAMPPALDRILGHGRSSLEEHESYIAAIKTESAKPFYLRKPLPEPKSPISGLLVPSFDVLTRGSVASTREQILKLMIALRSYSLEHGTYPDSLAGLKSYGMDTTDEFSGKPLKYKRVGKGYLLYSVGSDGKDNGGAPLRIVNDKSEGDIVAGKLFPPRK